jgi:hypothetical protein
MFCRVVPYAKAWSEDVGLAFLIGSAELYSSPQGKDRSTGNERLGHAAQSSYIQVATCTRALFRQETVEEQKGETYGTISSLRPLRNSIGMLLICGIVSSLGQI